MLKLIQDDSDPLIISRMKKSLMSKFKKTHSNDIEKAIELASFMIFDDQKQKAKEFLESFVYLKPSDNNEELWVTNANGVLLLAYLSKEIGELQKYRYYVGILLDHDNWPRDISKRRWIKMHLEEHEKIIQYAMTETHKYKCSVLSGEFLSYLYFYEMLFLNGKPGFLEKILEKRVLSILEHSKHLLRESLNNH